MVEQGTLRERRPPPRLSRNVKQYSHAWISLPQNVPECSCSILDLPRKFHENSLTRFPVMLLTDRQTGKQTARDENHNLRRSAEVIKGNSSMFIASPVVCELTVKRKTLFYLTTSKTGSAIQLHQSSAFHCQLAHSSGVFAFIKHKLCINGIEQFLFGEFDILFVTWRMRDGGAVVHMLLQLWEHATPLWHHAVRVCIAT